MIGIRSITYQLPEKYEDDHLKQVAGVSRLWDNSYPLLRTQRISLCPFSEPAPLSNFKKLSALCDETRVRWFNIPLRPSLAKSVSSLMSFGHSVLSEYSRAFVNVLGVENKTINRHFLSQYSKLAKRVSTISQDGKDNFRLGLSINIKPDCPFFPFTFSNGVFGFSIALELTQEINRICSESQNNNLAELQRTIITEIEPQIDSIKVIAEDISAKSGLEFKGFDFSLAPIIDPDGSVITILNSLGVYDFGNTGCLFATSFLTNILKHWAYKYKSVGFSGVMYSLLEDLELCSINNQRGVTLYQMISLSTMCGCGLDMVPVYGEIKNEELMSVYLEVAAISCRLNKPLGVRILPIQNCKRGSTIYTSFHDDPDFISNTKVVTPNMNLLSPFGDEFRFLPTQ